MSEINIGQLCKLIFEGLSNLDQVEEEIKKKDCYSGEEVAEALKILLEQNRQYEERISRLEKCIEAPQEDALHKRVEKLSAQIEEWGKYLESIDSQVESAKNRSKSESDDETKQKETEITTAEDKIDYDLLSAKIKHIFKKGRPDEAYEIYIKQAQHIGIPKTFDETKFLLYGMPECHKIKNKENAQDILDKALNFYDTMCETAEHNFTRRYFSFIMSTLNSFCEINELKNPNVLKFYDKIIEHETDVKSLMSCYKFRANFQEFLGNTEAAEADRKKREELLEHALKTEEEQKKEKFDLSKCIDTLRFLSQKNKIDKAWKLYHECADIIGVPKSDAEFAFLLKLPPTAVFSDSNQAQEVYNNCKKYYLSVEKQAKPKYTTHDYTLLASFAIKNKIKDEYILESLTEKYEEILKKGITSAIDADDALDYLRGRSQMYCILGKPEEAEKDKEEIERLTKLVEELADKL